MFRIFQFCKVSFNIAPTMAAFHTWYKDLLQLSGKEFLEMITNTISGSKIMRFIHLKIYILLYFTNLFLFLMQLCL
jgi:hypothetical protein